MENSFRLSIISSEKVIYSAEVLSLVVPAELGFMGILANHAPLVAHLGKGIMTVREKGAGEPRTFDSSGDGFIEVLKNNVTVIV